MTFLLSIYHRILSSYRQSLRLAILLRCLTGHALEGFPEQAELVKADGFGNLADGRLRLAQQQRGLFETVFDEIFIRRRIQRGVERAQAGGFAAMGALREVFERDVFGVVRGDVLEDAPCAYGWHVFVLLWLS